MISCPLKAGLVQHQLSHSKPMKYIGFPRPSYPLAVSLERTYKHFTMDLGILRTVSPRQKWQYEDRDFTPWLADNIQELGLAIGKNLIWFLKVSIYLMCNP
jgi:hypothetical protein